MARSSVPSPGLSQLFAQATALHTQGQLAQAKVLYERVLVRQPRHFEALNMLGIVCHGLRDDQQAIAFYERAIAVDPRHAAPFINLGVALKRCRRFEEALRCFDQAIALAPDQVQAHNNRGNVLQVLGRWDEAIASFFKALELRPDYVEAYYNLGNSLQALGRLDEALACYEQALVLRPDYVEAHNNRGIALKELHRLDEALASYDRALALRPDHAEVHNNYGNALAEYGRVDEAIACYDRALALHPGYAEAHYNRGTALKELKRVDESIACFDQAIALRPDYAEAHWNKSYMLLLAGDMARGWQLYEWRWKNTRARLKSRGFSQPLWLGEVPLAGQSILLHAEQGLGDTLQFCRYAKRVQALGAKVWLEVPSSLMGLLDGLEGVDALIEKGQPLPAFDCHCPLLSLPLAFKTSLDEMPSSAPYLSSRPDKRAFWRERLGPRDRPRVGLVWRGSADHTNDRRRSLPLADLLPYLPAHCDYVSLQKELRAEDAAVLASSAIRHDGEALQDFTDTAALCDLMDVVISVDTSVAHLAGALGRPTWVLLPYVPDWRWLLDRDDSPWYASVRLYRQAADRAWGTVLQQVAQDLSAQVKG